MKKRIIVIVALLTIGAVTMLAVSHQRTIAKRELGLDQGFLQKERSEQKGYNDLKALYFQGVLSSPADEQRLVTTMGLKSWVPSGQFYATTDAPDWWSPKRDASSRFYSKVEYPSPRQINMWVMLTGQEVWLVKVTHF